MATRKVDAVLFDSGGVLIGPRGGRWNPRFDFEAIVARRAPGLSRELFATAVEIGDRFLASGDGTPSRDNYHTVLLEVLGIESTPDVLAELDAPLDPASLVELYPDVIEVLDVLRTRGVQLAVVSDAWPELPELHNGVGLDGYFDVYAISAVLGCTKPDPRMYQHASDALGLPPERCLFVDDVPLLVEAAIELGYQGSAVLRDGSQLDDLRTVRDLSQLLPLIG